MPSRFGPLLYCENSDRLDQARARQTWKAARALVDAGVLQTTYNTHRGTVFYFKAGGLPVKREEVDDLVATRFTTPARYMKFWILRRATEHECSCHLFLKFGYCRQVFAVKIQLHGYRDACPTLLQEHGQRSDDASFDSDETDEEEAAPPPEGGEDEPDGDSSDEEEGIAPLPLQRSRRLAVVYNASAW